MNCRTALAAMTLACASLIPLAGTAQAQDLDCEHFVFQEDAQAEFERDRSDPHGLDEDPGPDDHIACEHLPRRNGAATPAPVIPPPLPVTPTVPPRTPTAVTMSPTVMPSRGAQGGTGGSYDPTGLEVGIGLGLAAVATAAGGYTLLRRRRSRT
ncbi:excalibur calcium-binding protein [Streptomyces sp. NPDC015346]|uniref:excalibur calcium-binding protein n=1 Tax=Streptomyces sp. NPDC015346 TaxID=3364954 RepID=UPI0036F7285F